MNNKIIIRRRVETTTEINSKNGSFYITIIEEDKSPKRIVLYVRKPDFKTIHLEEKTLTELKDLLNRADQKGGVKV